MFDSLRDRLPPPVAIDDPGFDTYLDQVTAIWAEELEKEPFGHDRFDGHPTPMTPETAAMIAVLDTERLSGHDRVNALKAHVAAMSFFQALVYEDIAAISAHTEALDLDAGLAHDVAASEIRAALTLTRRGADIEIDQALALCQRLPKVLDALKEGRIDRRRALAIADGTSHVPVAAARQVADEILADAERLTTGQIYARLRRLVIEIDPDEADRRFEEKASERKVVLEPTVDGTANLLGFDLPPDRAVLAYRRIDRIARSLRGPGELRSMDQLRSDVFADLLCGTSSPSRRELPGDGMRSETVNTSIHLTVDLATLAGLNDSPGDLAGYGPIIADIARRIAETSDPRFTYTVTDPETGRPLLTDATRRRPTADQQRQVTSHRPICIFPGCRHPASDCDIDHTRASSEGGPTIFENLAPLCRHDHRLKHEYGWDLEAMPDGGHRWTSPLGHTYNSNSRSP